MSFTSLNFIFGFLPLSVIGFLIAQRLGGRKLAINYLAVVSLVFYGLWGAGLLAILIGSLAFNYVGGNMIARTPARSKVARNIMMAGIAGNLLLLGYLKYLNFCIDIANQVSGASLSHYDLIVPIGVSFFTFVQIGYLVDAYNGHVIKHGFGRYIVFAAFFPCVTAGPLVLQREMMGQLEESQSPAFNLRRFVIGLTMFGMGLFKKVVLADSIAPYANTVFDAAATGVPVDAVAAWIGSVCYTLQLYFDFSGYSDMAIGLATLFAIRLPLNFNSPLKATNISDFWRRWHMTMTRFFTTYIYSGMALNGMRNSAKWQLGGVGRFMLTAAVPAFVTFLVAGVWHGSGLTFLIYGAMHGLAIATFLAWREFVGIRLPSPVAWAITMATVISCLTMFRAVDVDSAMHLLAQMWGLGLLGGPEGAVFAFDSASAISLIVLLGAVALLMPNTQQVLHIDWPVTDTKPVSAEMDAGLVAWRPTLRGAMVSAAALVIAITSIGPGTGFLYYQF